MADVSDDDVAADLDVLDAVEVNVESWGDFNMDDHAFGLGLMLLRWHEFKKIAGPGYEDAAADVERLRISAAHAHAMGIKKSCAMFVREMVETMARAQRRHARAEAAKFLEAHRDTMDPAERDLLEARLAQPEAAETAAQ